MPDFSFGAIRWDAWWNEGLVNGTQEIKLLNPLEYQFRAPIHAVKDGNVLSVVPTQQNFDNEILYASSVGGPKFYWVYLIYTGSIMNSGVEFHLTSSIADQQKFVIMVGTNYMGNYVSYQPTIDALVSKYFTKSYYYKLPVSGKPILYIYYSAADIIGYWGSNIANLATAIAYFKTKITSTVGVAPYIVVLSGTNDSIRSSIGADAISNYIPGFNHPLDGTYASLDTQAQSYWTSLGAAATAGGGQVVPICTMGWDFSPRMRRPETNSNFISEQGLRYKYAFPTNTEITNHTQAAVNFINANPTICPEKTILCYAWDENTEGGFLTKTFGDPTGTRLASAISPINSA